MSSFKWEPSLVKKGMIRHESTTLLTFQLREDKNTPAGSVLFFGDSHIQGMAVSGITQLASNFGIGHDTSAGLAKRIRKYDSIIKSRLVVVAIGQNDIGTVANFKIIDNIEDIIKFVPPEIPILISGIFPLDTNLVNTPNTNKIISKLNTLLRDICSVDARLHYLPPPHNFLTSEGNLRSEYHIGDGIHLNSGGNAVWVSKLQAQVEKIEQVGRDE